jgi:drug/metabolite transporter (DMT)-like permease
MTVILSYIFYFIAGTISPLQRRWLATRKSASNKGQIHFAFQVNLVNAILGLLLIFVQPLNFSGNIPYIALLGLACGVFGAANFALLFAIQKHVEAGVTTIVSNIYTPVTIILATLLLREGLTPMQMIGTVFLLIGMVVVSKKHHIGRLKFDKYFLLMLLSGVLLGILLTTERALQLATGITAGTLISWWSQCLVLGVIVLAMRTKGKYSARDVVVSGGLNFLHSFSWVLLLFTVGNLSLVSAVTTFKVVVVFVAAAIFLKEREDLPRKILGSLIALAGLLLMK